MFYFHFKNDGCILIKVWIYIRKLYFFHYYFRYLDSRFSLIGTGGLQITQVNKNDDGNYICRAENSEDSADASATLEVHGE